MPTYNDNNSLLASLSDIESQDNQKRRATSWHEWQMYKDNLHVYVEKYLRDRYGEDADELLKEMPIISSINIYQRIVNQFASIYKKAPKRSFVGANEKQKEVLTQIYADANIDKKLKWANRIFVMQQQALVYIVVDKNGMPKTRVLKKHQYDTIPDSENNEEAFAYFISAFDKTNYEKNASALASSQLQENKFTGSANPTSIAGKNDYKRNLKKYVVWSRDGFNAIVKDGKIISTDEDGNIDSISPEVWPFVDISDEKDGEYYNASPSVLSDFCIQFNAAITSAAHVVDMQGFAVGYISGPESARPDGKNFKIGPAKYIFLPHNDMNALETKVGFANPNADIEGTIKFIETLLFLFLSSRGIDAKSVVSTNGQGPTFTSALDRLFAMIEKFEATQDDIGVFEKTEQDIFDIIKAWHKTGLMDLKYNCPPLDNITLQIEFDTPSMIQTNEEKVNTHKAAMDLDLESIVDAVMDYHGLDEDEAIKKIAKIKEDKEKYGKDTESDIERAGSESDDQLSGLSGADSNVLEGDQDIDSAGDNRSDSEQD